ncbi:MAG: hypothetical protein JO270_15285 [Acidobacteriaceae bacterium]|nr:hypothetical protein [Acidobacteriaceae bacterium]
MIGTINEKMRCVDLDEHESFPAILIAVQDGLRQPLLRDLTAKGYLVFEARSEVEVLHIVVTQSRPICLLVAEANMITHQFARALKPYRRELQVLFVSRDSNSSFIVRDAEKTAARIQQMLKPPKKIAGKPQKNWLIKSDVGAAQLVTSSGEL